jgi:hypothetical protein
MITTSFPNGMEVLVLDTNFNAITVLDTVKSIIWTNRYNSFGDFEIYTPMTVELLLFLQIDYYLWLNGSEHIMIIEDRRIECNVEEGNYLIVTGRSLESILERRIVWDQTILSGNFQNGIQTLLNDAIISPTIIDRKIDNFIFEVNDDPAITSLIIDAQIPRGENLYNVIQTLCAQKNIGFKITLSDANQFVFKLYSGIDRSYEQIQNPYVVFSPSFDNLINADYSESKRVLKNVTVVAGEGEETVRKTTVVGSGSSLSRRELYTDANDISQNNGETVLSDEDYLAQLIQRGAEELSRCIITKSFDSQIDPVNNLFKYNEDFFMGDIVQIASDYGIESRVRVTEIIFSQNEEGFKIHPTLSIVDVGEVVPDGTLIPGTGGEPGGSIPQVDIDELTDGGDTDLHYHSSDRNRENHTGTQLASTISNFASTVLATVLTGLSLVTGTAITAADTILSALGKLQKQITDHKDNTLNPHNVTKTQVGLSNVTNDAQIPLTQKGAINGVAELDASGKVPSAQIPAGLQLGETSSTAYRGDRGAIAYNHSQAAHAPSNADKTETAITGASGKSTPIDADTIPLIDSAASSVLKKVTWANIKSTLKTYFDTIYSTLALGETSVTAYRGDRGKIAYDHSQLISGNPHNVTAANVGLGNVTNESKATMFTNAALTGNPTAPTQSAGDNSTRIATTAFVQQELVAAGGGDMMKSVYDTDDDGVVDKAASFIFVDGETTYRGWFSVVSGVLTFNYEEV